MRIILLGFMGSGKSTLGPVVAREGALDFVDLDAAIESAAGHSVAAIFREAGEAAFRDLECEALARWAARDGLVLATGGGIVERRENHAWLRQGHGVYLAWTWEALQDRLRSFSAKKRPLLAGGMEALEALWRRRDPLYRDLARQILPMRAWQASRRDAHLLDLARRILKEAGRE